jgi:hypothetical protein
MAQGIDEKIKRRFDENKLNSQAPTPMAPVGQSQAGNVGVQQPAGAPAKSGAFTNVQSFLKANQGAGSRLADKTTEGVGRGVQQATGQVDQFEKQVGGAVDKEKARVDDTDRIAKAVEESTSPTIFENEQDVNAAKQLIKGQTAVADIEAQKKQLGAQAYDQLTQAGQQTGQLGTQSGRFNLLRRAVGGSMYSQGMSGLDNLLMSTEGGQQLGRAQRDLTGNLNLANQTLDTKAGKFKSDLDVIADLADKAKTRVTGAVTTSQSNLEKDLQTTFEKAEEQRKLNDELVGLIESGQGLAQEQSSQYKTQDLTPKQKAYYDLLDSLGGNASTYGVNLGEFINDKRAINDKWTLANQDQATKYNKLNELLGITTEQTAGGKSVADFGKQINKDDFLGAVKGREAEYNRALDSTKSTLGNKQYTAAGAGVTVDRNALLDKLVKDPNSVRPYETMAEFLAKEHPNMDTAAVGGPTLTALWVAHNRSLAEVKPIADKLRNDFKLDSKLIRK